MSIAQWEVKTLSVDLKRYPRYLVDSEYTSERTQYFGAG